VIDELGEWLEMEDPGFIGLIGPIFYRPLAGGMGRFRFLGEPKHQNRNGVVHGGMLMAFADRSLGFTARQNAPDRKQATIQLDVHFIRPARIGQTIDMECRIVRETRSLAFVDGVLTVDGETIATARGVWKITSPGVPPENQVG
jgi:uncharacterized protein (TIGR00369 family)